MDKEQEKLPLTNAKKTTTQNNPPVTDLSDKIALTILTSVLVFVAYITCPFPLDKDRTYPKFNIKDLTVSSLNIGDDKILSANFNITFDVDNPKKGFELLYHEPMVSIYYGSVTVSKSNITTFHQNAGQESSMDAFLTSSGVHVGTSMAQGINFVRTWRKAVTFGVEVTAKLTVNPGSQSETRIDMTVMCCNIEVTFPKNGKNGKFSPGIWDWCTFN